MRGRVPPEQLSLFDLPDALPPRGRRPARSPEPETRLRLELRRFLGRPLSSLVLTDNRSRILSVRTASSDGSAGLHLRLHRSFVTAPPEVLAEVAAFVGGRARSPRRRRALAAIRAHFESHREPVPRARRPPHLRPVGRTLDLRQVRDDLNRRFFGARLTAEITWGRAPSGTAFHCPCGRRRKRTSIQLGSYTAEDDLIRVHRTLDHPNVPRYVVESIVYHELLHADLPAVVANGRRLVHTREFRRRERLFPDHARAARWVAENLSALLRRRLARRR